MRSRGAARAALHLLVRPVILVYLAARVRNLRKVPMPRDSGHGLVPGRDPLRVTVIGDATAVGYGTVSQQLGVAAHFARQLSRRDERGVEWTTAQFRQLTLRNAHEVVADGALFERTDRVVVIAGIRDAIGLIPVAIWAELMEDLLVTIRSRLPTGASVTVAEIPPLEFYSSIPAGLRRLVAGHARDLNGATREVVARHQGARTIAFTEKHAIDLQEPGITGVSALYLAWAQTLLAAEEPQGDAARREDQFPGRDPRP